MRLIRKKGIGTQTKGSKIVALFGGAFNPPHRGHVAMVRALLKEPTIDDVWVLPVYRHPFGKEMLPFAQRLAMCRLAFSTLSPRVRVRPLEKRLGGRSYTIRVLKYLKKLYPRIDFKLVMGADSYRDRHQWHDMVGIRQRVDLIVFPRGQRSEIPSLSSTALRRALKQKREITPWVPKSVAQYIKEKQLWL